MCVMSGFREVLQGLLCICSFWGLVSIFGFYYHCHSGSCVDFSMRLRSCFTVAAAAAVRRALPNTSSLSGFWRVSFIKCLAVATGATTSSTTVICQAHSMYPSYDDAPHSWASRFEISGFESAHPILQNPRSVNLIQKAHTPDFSFMEPKP